MYKVNKNIVTNSSYYVVKGKSDTDNQFAYFYDRNANIIKSVKCNPDEVNYWKDIPRFESMIDPLTRGCIKISSVCIYLCPKQGRMANFIDKHGHVIAGLKYNGQVTKAGILLALNDTSDESVRMRVSFPYKRIDHEYFAKNDIKIHDENIVHKSSSCSIL